MTAVVDYGLGNLFSLASSLRYIGARARVTNSAREIAESDRVLLPGVGAFRDAEERLRSSGLADAVLNAAASGKPILGVCLGMQLLFDRSCEYGEYRGLGLIPGDVVPLAPELKGRLKVPHIGWNALRFPRNRAKSPLFRYIDEGAYVYFVHSYAASRCAEDTIATTEYGVEVTAAVSRGNVFGTQFHPEKSGDVGLHILRAFCEMRG